MLVAITLHIREDDYWDLKNQGMLDKTWANLSLLKDQTYIAESHGDHNTTVVRFYDLTPDIVSNLPQDPNITVDWL